MTRGAVRRKRGLESDSRYCNSNFPHNTIEFRAKAKLAFEISTGFCPNKPFKQDSTTLYETIVNVGKRLITHPPKQWRARKLTFQLIMKRFFFCN